MKVKILIALVLAAVSSLAAAESAYSDTGRRILLASADKPAKNGAKIENVTDQISALSKQISNDSSGLVNKLKGKYTEISDVQTFSSGNAIADVMFGAKDKFNLVYNAKIDEVDVDAGKMFVTIVDGEAQAIKETLGYGHKQMAQEIISENRGKGRTLDLYGQINSILWARHVSKKYKAEDVGLAIFLSEHADILKIDTVAWVLADNGYPVTAVQMIYKPAIEKLKNGSEAAEVAKYEGYMADII